MKFVDESNSACHLRVVMSLQQKSIVIKGRTLLASRGYKNRILWHVFDKSPGSNMGPGMSTKECRQFLSVL